LAGFFPAITEPELWQVVRDRLAANRCERALAAGAEASSLLAGLIVDRDGNRLTPTHATKKGRRYRYYVSASLLASDRRKHTADAGPGGRDRGARVRPSKIIFFV
jgi:site-specific DNA recombinase